ncbi:MAG TPA: M20/M25/M40 family metallo-hydrolase [Acidimicrobiales bacterium]|nr:M20/M25/M40 family metallo-hydrolase [Acidimicrobiales bacterium]
MSGVESERSLRALARLRHLTELESPSGHVACLNEMRDALASRWRELELDVTITPGRAGDHLVGEWHVPGSAGHVLLVTHYDTVWSEGELERQPFVVEGDRVFGPGVFDMKAGIVAIEFALEELRREGRAPARTVRIVCIADEEVSSVDGRRVIEEAAEGAVAVLGFEPAHPDGAFKSGRRGVARLLLRVTGRESHSGLAAGEGISAIDELVDLLLDVRHGAPLAADASINVGRISGGTRANVVPGVAEAEVGLRFGLPATERALLDLFHGLRVHRDGATLEVITLSHRPAWPEDPHSSLTELVLATARAQGESAAARPAGGAGDTNFTGAAGLATLDGLGPRGANAHAVGEVVSLSSLAQRISMLVELLSNEALGE